MSLDPLDSEGTVSVVVNRLLYFGGQTFSVCVFSILIIFWRDLSARDLRLVRQAGVRSCLLCAIAEETLETGRRIVWVVSVCMPILFTLVIYSAVCTCCSLHSVPARGSEQITNDNTVYALASAVYMLVFTFYFCWSARALLLLP